jgi:hypothetical protein
MGDLQGQLERLLTEAEDWEDRVRHPDNHLDDNEDPEGKVRASETERDPIHWPRVLMAVLCIGLLGAGAAVAWHYTGTDAASGSPAVPHEPYLPLKDFERYQQTTAVGVQDSKDKLHEQDVKIKQLSDQIGQLNATLNALQVSAREAQASVPPSQTPKVPKKNAEHRSAHSPAAPVSLSPDPHEEH